MAAEEKVGRAETAAGGPAHASPGGATTRCAGGAPSGAASWEQKEPLSHQGRQTGGGTLRMPGSPHQSPDGFRFRIAQLRSRTDTTRHSGRLHRESLPASWATAGDLGAQGTGTKVPSPGGNLSTRKRRLLKETSQGSAGALPLGGIRSSFAPTERDTSAAPTDLQSKEVWSSWAAGASFGKHGGCSIRGCSSGSHGGVSAPYEGAEAKEDPCSQHPWSWGSEDFASDPPMALDPLEHEWMLIIAEGQYESIIGPLTSDPSLLSRRDFVTGYSALHWLAKHGKHDDLIQLIRFAEAQGVPVDINSRASGGLTPLHIAAMQGHEMLIKVLVGAFSADVHLRDHSGRKAWQYLRANASRELKELSGGDEEEANLASFNKNNNSRSSKRASKKAVKGDEVDGGRERKSELPVRTSPFRNLFRRFKLYLSSEIGELF